MQIYDFCCEGCGFSINGDVAVSVGAAARAKQNDRVCLLR